MGAASPGLLAELLRLQTVGAQFLGIVGDANHTWGYHVPSSRVLSSDYSMQGAANRPVGDFACAIDIGMRWPASRDWLRWLIREIRDDRIQGISEVIGSYDGHNVRYWSDNSGWHTDGVAYQGTGHDTWTHIGIYRSTAYNDHGLLAGWTATGLANSPQEDDMQLSDRITGTHPETGVYYDFSVEEFFEGTNTAAWKAVSLAEQAHRRLDAADKKLDAILTKLAAVAAGNVDVDALATKLTPKIAEEIARRLDA